MADGGPKKTSEFRRFDTAAERLPEAVRRRLDRTLKRKVVVVDDDRVTLRLFHKLVPKGWLVETFDNAEEALAVVIADDPIAVIADLRIPGQDGITFLGQLAQVRDGVRRVLMSSFRDQGDFVRAINEAAIYRFLAKPLTRETVHDVLDEALAQRRRELAVEYLVEDLRAQNDQLAAASVALEQRQAHLLHSERLAVLGRLTDGLAEGMRPLLAQLDNVRGRLHRAVKDPEDRELVAMGKDAVESVRDIVDHIGRFTRDGEMKVHPVPTDLRELVARSVRFACLDRRFKAREVETRLDAVPLTNVDPRRVRQLLLNLMRNAADATGEGETIVVRVYPKDEEVVIAVRDTGRGMPAHVIEHIFEDFFSTKGQDGLGLGLSLSRRIAQEHEGTIRCTSAVGHGTCFFVTFPVMKPDKRAAITGPIEVPEVATELGE